MRIDKTGNAWEWWEDFWTDVSNWLTGEKEKAATNDDGTATIGVTCSAAFGAALSVSAGITYDMHGNIGLAATGNTGAGFPSAGVGLFISGSNAPNIYKQNGLGATVGASGGPAVVAVGAEYNMLIDQEAGTVYHGGTASATVGLYPTVVEVHGEVGYTGVIGFNVFDVLINISNWLAHI